MALAPVALCCCESIHRFEQLPQFEGVRRRARHEAIAHRKRRAVLDGAMSTSGAGSPARLVSPSLGPVTCDSAP